MTRKVGITQQASDKMNKKKRREGEGRESVVRVDRGVGYTTMKFIKKMERKSKLILKIRKNKANLLRHRK